MSYLAEILEQQRVDPAIEEAVRARRVEIERILQAEGRPRFYYGGSFGKKTMIAAQFDLDVVLYFPAATADGPEALYAAVERRLRAAGHHVARQNVALRLRYTPGWHIDVVPGRALDDTYEYADLYSSDTAAPRRTSLKQHIALARNGDREIIKLMKLWRHRNAVPVGSFVLELAAARALSASAGGTLEDRFATVLRFLADSFVGARLVDPANPHNIVTDDLDWARKVAIAQCAAKSCESPWSRVVW
jgi:hypothetical protein